MGFIDTLSREYTYVSNMMRTLRRMGKLTPASPSTVPDVIDHWARTRPNNIAILFEDRIYTYRELDEEANRVARWAREQGLQRGDVVALLMENRPEFIFTWLGILKVGGVAALINTNLSAQPLAHSIAISGAKLLVLGAELAENFATAVDRLETRIPVWAEGGRVQGTDDLNAALADVYAGALPASIRAGMTANDRALYIYTSGTTGLPKAASISHLRMQNMMHAFGAATNATEKDRMYDVLPLYHSAGGICALGAAFTSGASVVIRRKFSASHFWDDCAKYKPTLFQYIGELCRYLLNTPEHPLERQHALRMAIGNGLRPEIWPTFQERFRIPKILEFYGATEGNVALLNVDGKVGSIGRIPRYMRNVLKTRIIKFDVDTEQPIRDPATGFCTECKPGEVGEAIGRITDDPRSRFEGYTKSADTEKKILRDVFEKGDAWFRSGDLLKQDADGYFYFIDRIGDTFRWKGENVATSEVAEAIGVFPGVKEANVYGVKVGTLDGRAGMASIVLDGDVDFPSLYAHLTQQLPAYARPYFVRLQPTIEITGTFKHRKVELVREGFDPSMIAEPLYFRDDAKGTFVPLDAALHARILSGEVKL